MSTTTTTIDRQILADLRRRTFGLLVRDAVKAYGAEAHAAIERLAAARKIMLVRGVGARIEIA